MENLTPTPEEVQKALRDKQEERLYMGLCPYCEPTIWLAEFNGGYICPKCKQEYETLQNGATD